MTLAPTFEWNLPACNTAVEVDYGHCPAGEIEIRDVWAASERIELTEFEEADLVVDIGAERALIAAE